MSRITSAHRWLIIVGALSLVLAACTAGTPVATDSVDQEEAAEAGHDEASQDEVSDAEVDRVVDVVLSEFAIEMDSSEFSAGETVKFMVVNEGAIEHEFRLSNRARIDDHMGSGHESDDHDEAASAEGDHDEAAQDFFINLAAGESGELVVTFPDEDGAYTEAACLVPGHYEANMKTDVAVDGTVAAEAGHDEDAAAEDHDESAAAEDHDEGAAEEGDHDEEMVEADRVVDVTLSEFAIDMGATEFSAGETVTFVVTNEGAIEHEFRLSNEHRIEEHMASGHDDDDHDDTAPAEAGHEEVGDVFLVLAAGEEGMLTVTFPEDVTVYTEAACLLPGHYEANMKADIEVG